MRRAIGKHLGDFLAIIALVLLAAGIGGYILANQRLRFPFVEEKPFRLKVELPDAQAVQPGQGQTVRVAGIEVGQIGKVELEDGRAVVEMNLEPKYEDLVRRDATALLRTKTGLKDMFIEVDPGHGRPLEEDERIPVRNTNPDIDPDEILDALDSDTRDYLKLLISGAGKGLRGRSTDLRETLARLGPLHRDLQRVSRAVARRRGNLSRLVNNYGRLTTELGRNDRDIVRLVQRSNDVLGALASENQSISAAVSKLPGSLRQTQRTLAKVDDFSARLRPALNALRPPFRRLATTNRQVLPFVREATPIVRKQIRPFVRIATPYFQSLGLSGRDLSRAAPDLTTSFEQLNRLLNIGAFNPGGAEGIAGKSLGEQRAREEGYLYWLAWLGQNTVSLFNTADAHGVLRRITLGGAGVNCSIFLGLGLPQAIVDVLGNLGVCVKTSP